MSTIISISGDIGSGKSAVTQALQKLTQYDSLSTGSLQRAIAEQRGITTLALNQLSASDRSVDDELDEQLRTLGRTRQKLIVDSRLAWHFIPSSFKVYLSVSAQIGAQRVFSARRATEQNHSLAETRANNQLRQSLELQRFAKLYGIDFKDLRHYDLVIDTSQSGPEEVAVQIKQRYDARLNERSLGSPQPSPTACTQR